MTNFANQKFSLKKDLSSIANYVIYFGIFLRVLYAINVDQLSGQDAPSYYPSAIRILEYGVFADKISAPAFPVGYTWFVAAVLWISGGNLIILSIFQIALFAVSLLRFRNTVRDLFNPRISAIFCILISLSPAQITAVTLVMYEIPMMSLFMLGAALLLESLEEKNSRNKLWFKSILAGSMFAFAVAMQPKILSAISAFIVAAFWRKRIAFRESKKNAVKLTLSLILVVTSLALGPASLLIRNYQAGDGIGLTQNYATNIFVGAQNTGVSLHAEACDKFKNTDGYDSFNRSICLQKTKFSNIGEGLNISRQQMVNFWLPYIGELKFRGTWYHALDFRRLFPSYEYWTGKDKLIDQFLSWIWVSLFVFFLAIGCKFSIKHFGLPTSLLLILPITSLWLVSISTYGESRYRIPIAFLYYVLIGISFSELFSWKQKRKLTNL